MSIKIIPAIDLIGGAIVRLKQGLFEERVNYSTDPVRAAEGFARAGARYLHMVDLDGARAGRPMQRDIVQYIAEETELAVQVGGGIRHLRQVEDYLKAGAKRVVIGSLAVRDPETTRAIIDAVGEAHITLAFDFKRAEEGGIWPAVDAWMSVERLAIDDLFGAYRDYPLLEYLCTDISRDGCLSGIDPSFYRELLRASRDGKIIVSGGVTNLTDVSLTRDLGLHGLVVGKALHDGLFDLREALRC